MTNAMEIYQIYDEASYFDISNFMSTFDEIFCQWKTNARKKISNFKTFASGKFVALKKDCIPRTGRSMLFKKSLKH